MKCSYLLLLVGVLALGMVAESQAYLAWNGGTCTYDFNIARDFEGSSAQRTRSSTDKKYCLAGGYYITSASSGSVSSSALQGSVAQ